MSRRTREPDPDLITNVIAWLMRESEMEIEQLQRLELELRKRHGGRFQWVAARTFFALDERNALIHEAWLSDVPPPKIAKQFNLTTRRVRQICAGLPRQGGLFSRAATE